MRRIAAAATLAFLLGSLISPLRASSPEIVLQPGESYTVTVRAATAPPSVPAPTAAPTAVPTASPTAAPTAAPTAVPTVAPSVDPWAVAFGTRPVSGPIVLSGAACQGIVIEGKTFANLGLNVNAIRLTGCNGVTIRNNDFLNVAQGVTVTTSTNVRIERNRYRNILGPHARVGINRGDFVQFISTTGYIGYNKGEGIAGEDPEDLISIYQSYGTQANPIVIEYNAFEGSAWTSTSGSGIMLGDGGGSWQIARYNTLLTPGQVGIGVASGTNISVIGNTLYGEGRTGSNVGISVWNQYATPCSNITVSGNKARWWKANGTRAEFWSVAPGVAGYCGPIVNDTPEFPTGNDYSTPVLPASIAVNL